MFDDISYDFFYLVTGQEYAPQADVCMGSTKKVSIN